jgi:hypothetical protein
MTTHRSTPIRRITHKRRRSGIRAWISALLRGKTDADTAAVRMAETDKRGPK